MNTIKLKHSKAMPIIFAVLGAAGVIGSTVITTTQTAKACKALDKAKAKKGSELTKKEVVETAASFYIPVVVVDVATVGCIACSSVLSRKQNLALMSGCTAMGNYIRDYRTKTATLVGVEQEARINEAALQHTNCQCHYGDKTIAPDRNYRFVDTYSGQSVESTERNMIDAFYHINRNYCLKGTVSMNDIYEFTGMNAIDGGDDVGFDISSELYWIDVEFELVDEAANPPAVNINYIWGPEDLEQYR